MQKIQKGYWKDIIAGYEQIGNMRILYTTVPWAKQGVYYTQFQPHLGHITIVFLEKIVENDLIIEPFDNVEIICPGIERGYELSNITPMNGKDNTVTMQIKLTKIF